MADAEKSPPQNHRKLKACPCQIPGSGWRVSCRWSGSDRGCGVELCATPEWRFGRCLELPSVAGLVVCCAGVFLGGSEQRLVCSLISVGISNAKIKLSRAPPNFPFFLLGSHLQVAMSRRCARLKQFFLKRRSERSRVVISRFGVVSGRSRPGERTCFQFSGGTFRRPPYCTRLFGICGFRKCGPNHR